MVNPNPSFNKSTQAELKPGVFSTKLPGLLYIEYKKFIDERGFFTQFYQIPNINQALATPFEVKQMNWSHSQTNVVRGFHAEGWNKLVTTMSGIAYCVLADIRQNSPTFGQTESFLFEFNPTSPIGSGLFIPAGIANSICVLQGPVNYLYVVDKIYEDRDPSQDTAIYLFDPDLKAEWPIAKDQMICSARDLEAVTLKKFVSQHAGHPIFNFNSF